MSALSATKGGALIVFGAILLKAIEALTKYRKVTGDREKQRTQDQVDLYVRQDSFIDKLLKERNDLIQQIRDLRADCDSCGHDCDRHHKPGDSA